MDSLPPSPAEFSPTPLGPDGLTGWQVRTALCRALISRQGAQVLAFQAVGKKPLLWCSERAAYRPGTAIRGGIPLCFPWFGPHPADPGRPAHGFARLRDWALVTAEKRGELLHLAFRLESDGATHALWPHDFRATLGMTLGRSLSLQLHVENTGSTDFRFGFAFHSYLPVADIQRTLVEGLDGTLYIDQLHPGRARRRQQGPLRFAGETDRIYLHAPAQCLVCDEAGGQALRLSASGCRSVIVWNPWQEKTARLADMAPAAWRGMVCVESGNVADDEVGLPAGASKVFALRLEGEA